MADDTRANDLQRIPVKLMQDRAAVAPSPR